MIDQRCIWPPWSLAYRSAAGLPSAAGTYLVVALKDRPVAAPLSLRCTTLLADQHFRHPIVLKRGVFLAYSKLFWPRQQWQRVSVLVSRELRRIFSLGSRSIICTSPLYPLVCSTCPREFAVRSRPAQLRLMVCSSASETGPKPISARDCLGGVTAIARLLFRVLSVCERLTDMEVHVVGRMRQHPLTSASCRAAALTLALSAACFCTAP